MKISKHAEVRCQQRGIPIDHIPIIMMFGTPTEIKNGVTEYRMMKTDVKWLLQRINKLEGQTLIVGNDETVITSYLVKKRSVDRNS